MAVRMEKRHFELIADTIAHLPLSLTDKLTVANSFGERLATTNSQFKPGRFIDACMVDYLRNDR